MPNVELIKGFWMGKESYQATVLEFFMFRSWVAIFQLCPPMASFSRSSYDMPGLALRMDVLFWRRRDFQIASRTGIRQGTIEIVIEKVLWSIRGSYQTIWSSPLINVKWHSVTRPYTMTTHYWSDFIPSCDLITELDLLPNFERFP